MLARSLEERFQRAKRAFTTRRVPIADMCALVNGNAVPRPGNVVLARVDKLGRHKNLESVDGRRASLLPGDEIIVCFANRYAPDQFEAEVGGDLRPCHLVAGGGIASTALSWHDSILRPTAITPIGLVADKSGGPINLHSYAIDGSRTMNRVPSIAVLGTSMNAGKTTTAAALVRGLSAAGERVGAVKLTGTGSGGDTWSMRDAGAYRVLDFLDAGYASTYLMPLADLDHMIGLLTRELAAQGCSAIVAEVADGLYQRETMALLQSGQFKALYPRIVFAAQDAMGAHAGVGILRESGFEILGISGTLTRSTLAMREAAAAAVTVPPSMRPAELSNAENAAALLHAQTSERSVS